MALSVEEIRKAVENQTGSRAKQLAMLHQNRLRFHTQTEASAPMVLAARKVGGRQPLALPSQGVWQAVDDFLAFVEGEIADGGHHGHYSDEAENGQKDVVVLTFC